MEGIAIQVPNVDWSGNNVGKVTIIGGEGPTIDTQALYNNYITKSGRPPTPEILNMMNDLVAGGFTPTDTSIFYLAAEEDHTERVMYNAFDTTRKMVHSHQYDGYMRVGPKGSWSNKDQWGNSGNFNTGNYVVTHGFFIGVIVSEAEKRANTWTVGGGYSKDEGSSWTFNTGSGGYELVGLALRNKSSASRITKVDDPTEPIGVVVCGSNAIGPHTYKHNDLPLIAKTYSFVPGGMTSVTFPLSWSKDILKLIVVVNKALKNKDVENLASILKKYETLL